MDVHVHAFTNGMVSVSTPGPHSVVEYRDAVTNGTIERTGNNLVVTADLVPTGPSCTTNCAPLGGPVTMNITLVPPLTVGQNSIGGGSATLAAVPEPGTLCLLGTSVIRLAGMVRRRLGLGK